MPLTPPERWGTGNSRRRIRLSEAFITQTHGGAAGDVVTSMEFPTPSQDKTGTVAGTTTISGAITGSKGTSKAVTGSIAYTGAITGREGSPGAVTGETAYTGTIAGIKGAQGATAAEIAYTGTITGTSSGGTPTPPAPTRPTGGRPWWSRYPAPQAPAPRPIERKSGKVSGRTYLIGKVSGSRGASAQRSAEPIALHCRVVGTKATSHVVLGRTQVRGHTTGYGLQVIPTAELRRIRDDAEVLLLI